MRISFIIPVYNAEAYIDECTDSIFSLSEYDSNLIYEIILIDDGSSDHSLKRLKEIKKKKDGIIPVTVFHQDNKGVSSARNKGIELANYEYIIFVDADDTINSKLLYQVIQEQRCCPNVDLIIYGLSFDYYHKGICFKSNILVPAIQLICCREEWIQYMHLLFTDNMLSPIWNKIIKKSILIDNNIHLDTGLVIYEDLLLSLNIMGYCNEILFIQKPVYHYKQFINDNHAGKRLSTIPHINALVDKVDRALYYVDEDNKRKILIRLYGYLIIDKIKYSTPKSILTICKDFQYWVDSNKYKEYVYKRPYLFRVYSRKVFTLFLRKYYTHFHQFFSYRFQYYSFLINKMREELKLPFLRCQ